MMNILVTNDDGVTAPGLEALSEAVKGFGNLTIVAPDSERSAASHSITLFDPLNVNQISMNGHIAWSCSGTPVDCVKIALTELMDPLPDLVVSGINRGSNTGQNILYSGTVSAAVESMFSGIPAIAFSITSWEVDDYAPAKTIARQITEKMLELGLPKNLVLNVNIPPIPLKDIKGMRFTRQSLSRYDDFYHKEGEPPMQQFRLDGSLETIRDEDGNDDQCVEDGWVSMTPLQFNLTDQKMYKHLKTTGSDIQEKKESE